MAVAFASDQLELVASVALAVRAVACRARRPRPADAVPRLRPGHRAGAVRGVRPDAAGRELLLRGQVQPRGRGDRRAGRHGLPFRGRLARRAPAPPGARARPGRHALLEPGEGARPDRGRLPGRSVALRGRLRVGAVQARAPRARLGDRAAPAGRRLDERLPAVAQVRRRAGPGAAARHAGAPARAAPVRDELPRGLAVHRPGRLARGDRGRRRAARRARSATGSRWRC